MWALPVIVVMAIYVRMVFPSIGELAMTTITGLGSTRSIAILLARLFLRATCVGMMDGWKKLTTYLSNVRVVYLDLKWWDVTVDLTTGSGWNSNDGERRWVRCSHVIVENMWEATIITKFLS